mmetsp:Transcript_2207/g.14624  ORF Transcript_2207/g.14624 Transcript_2207/m.14624 type:complete len:454 (-) Transcript_2207:1613-2974(-)
MFDACSAGPSLSCEYHHALQNELDLPPGQGCNMYFQFTSGASAVQGVPSFLSRIELVAQERVFDVHRKRFKVFAFVMLDSKQQLGPVLEDAVQIHAVRRERLERGQTPSYVGLEPLVQEKTGLLFEETHYVDVGQHATERQQTHGGLRSVEGEDPGFSPNHLRDVGLRQQHLQPCDFASQHPDVGVQGFLSSSVHHGDGVFLSQSHFFPEVLEPGALIDSLVFVQCSHPSTTSQQRSPDVFVHHACFFQACFGLERLDRTFRSGSEGAGKEITLSWMASCIGQQRMQGFHGLSELAVSTNATAQDHPAYGVFGSHVSVVCSHAVPFVFRISFFFLSFLFRFHHQLLLVQLVSQIVHFSSECVVLRSLFGPFHAHCGPPPPSRASPSLQRAVLVLPPPSRPRPSTHACRFRHVSSFPHHTLAHTRTRTVHSGGCQRTRRAREPHRKLRMPPFSG